MDDFVGDNNPTYLYKAADAIELPDYVKNAPVTTTADVESLPARSFADELNRLFPIHTKAACALSAICFYGKGYADVRIERAIEKAAAAHGINDLHAEICKALSPTIKLANRAQPQYALAIQDEDDTRYFYPIDTEVDLTESARWLTKDANAQHLPLSFVRTAAMAMVKRAAALGMEAERILPPEVVAIGEDRIVDFERAKQALESRRLYCGVDDDGMKLYHDTLESAKAAYHRDEPLDEYLEVVRIIDDANRVKYSALIRDPHQVFYAGPLRSEVEKFATEVIFVGDVPVPSETFAALSDAEIEGTFRAGAADAVKEAKFQALGNAYGATGMLADLGPENERALLRLLLQKAA